MNKRSMELDIPLAKSYSLAEIFRLSIWAEGRCRDQNFRTDDLHHHQFGIDRSARGHTFLQKIHAWQTRTGAFQSSRAGGDHPSVSTLSIHIPPSFFFAILMPSGDVSRSQTTYRCQALRRESYRGPGFDLWDHHWHLMHPHCGCG